MLNPLRERFARFIPEASGAVALIFALSIFLLFSVVGGAIDFARVYRAQTAIQNALDAGVLAATRVKQLGGGDDAALTAAHALFDPVKSRFEVTGASDFRFTEGGATLTANVDLGLRTLFLGVIGMPTLTVKAGTKASFGNGGASSTDVELVMMLDVTGSMCMPCTKIDALKVAAEDLIEIVVQDNQSGAQSRVGIAPFSSSVQLPDGLFRDVTTRVVGAPSPTSGLAYSGCVTERGGAQAYTEAAPGPGAYLTPLETDPNPVGRDEPWERESCNGDREVIPLSKHKAQLKDAVRRLSTGGRTAGHIGTAWAWYLLSPNWAPFYPGDSRPDAYSRITERHPNGEQKLRKIAVLMTDGEYNTHYRGSNSPTQARELCTRMKATGIEVYTVGFDLGGNATAIATLRHCASDESKFYNATTGEELRQAFRDIAIQAVPLRLVQ